MGPFFRDEDVHNTSGSAHGTPLPPYNMDSTERMITALLQKLEKGETVTPEESHGLKEVIVSLQERMKMSMHPVERKQVADMLTRLQDVREQIDERRFGEVATE